MSHKQSSTPTSQPCPVGDCAWSGDEQYVAEHLRVKHGLKAQRIAPATETELPDPAIPHIANMSLDMLPAEMRGDEAMAAALATEQLRDISPSSPTSPSSPADPGSMAAALSALQAQMLALQTELATVKATQGGASVIGDGVGGYPWMYYRKTRPGSDQGWIIAAPGGSTAMGARDAGSYAANLQNGFVPIEKYGACPVPTQGGEWSLAALFIPFLRSGGARELPLSQVIAYNWHVRPPIRGLAFPQYEEARSSVVRCLCPECDFQLYGVKGDTSMPRAFFLHLRRAHEYPRTEASKLLTAQGLPLIGSYGEVLDDSSGSVLPTEAPALA